MAIPTCSVVLVIGARGDRLLKLDPADYLVLAATGRKIGVLNGRYAVLWSLGGARRPDMIIHRLICTAMLGRDLTPEERVDHINGDGFDNRRSNLRVCSHAENLWNRGKQKNNKSGFKGVTFHGPSGKWRARITAMGVVHSLGLFDTRELAFGAYREAAKNLHGEYANYGEAV